MRGQADYGALAAKEVSASISDMGEVAARLGSIVTYDKRGDVVDFDNFEGPSLKWNTSATGAGSAIYLDSTYIKSGSQSVRLKTGNILNGAALIVKNIAVLSSLKLGVEVSFNLASLANDLRIWLSYYSGAVLVEAGLKFDLTNGILYIQDSAGNWKELATGLVLSTEPFIFHTLKLVADFATGYYKRLLFNFTEYDLSEAMYRGADLTTAPQIRTSIQLVAKDSVGGSLWIDDAIWTQAEP